MIASTEVASIRQLTDEGGRPAAAGGGVRNEIVNAPGEQRLLLNDPGGSLTELSQPANG